MATMPEFEDEFQSVKNKTKTSETQIRKALNETNDLILKTGKSGHFLARCKSKFHYAIISVYGFGHY